MTKQIAASKIAEWRARPDIFVKEVFGAAPDAWQKDVLLAFPHNMRLAMVACRGPGKTCLLAWLIWNFMLTRPDPVIAVTSITADALSDTIWAELSRWMNKSPILKNSFTFTKTRIFSNVKDKSESWFITARPWPKSADSEAQALTLSGLHAEYIMFVLDESGGIPTPVMVAAEMAMSSCKEGHILQAGNPTNLEGPLYDACHKDKHLWHVTHISADPDDPKRTPRVSKEWAQQQIDKEADGRLNPYVMVNILGQFPPSSFNALLGRDEVEAAAKRYYREQDYFMHPRILGVDVATTGGDASVIFPRQGLMAQQPLLFRNISGTSGADEVIRKYEEWKADAVFVDNTGGFGSSWIDNMRRLGYSPVPVHFSETKGVDEKYFNRRAKMYWELSEWIKSGGAIPDIKELKEALYKTTYTHKKGKLIIEPKEDLKAKLGYSPDHADALALSFSSTVQKQQLGINANRNSNISSYDPLSLSYIKNDIGGGKPENQYFSSSYDPLNIDYLKKN